MVKALMTIEEARDAVRVDGSANDVILEPLLMAIPDYLIVKTGKEWAKEDATAVDPLAKAVAKFILMLWYNPQTEDIERINRTIDSLLVALTLKDNE